MRQWLLSLCFLAGLSAAAPVAAETLQIEVVGGKQQNRPALAVPSFANEALLASDFSAIIRQDLARTGAFSLLETGDAAPASAANLPAGAWTNQGAVAVTVGQVQSRGAMVDVRFELLDAARKTPLTGGSFSISRAQSRQLAHQIADMIYQQMTGKRGIASTRIAFVNRQAGQFLLQIADWDGGNAQTILRSSEPIISPAWSPDGSRLAYVSFEAKKPVIFVHHLASGSRAAISRFKGSNSAPAWSEDGRFLAVVLTRDGHSQIYRIPADGGEPVRLVHSRAIDTEPTFAPDGRLFFTSDRAGSPQIYVRTPTNGAITRVTYTGAYNVSPTVAPDGSALAWVRREAGRFRVVLLEQGQPERYLSQTSNDESPSFSPNGDMLLYVSDGALFTMSRDGLTRTRLSTPSGEISSPAWGRLPR